MVRSTISAFVAFAVILIVLNSCPMCHTSLPYQMVEEFFEMKSIRITYLKPCSFTDALELTKYLNVQSKFYTKVMRSLRDVDESFLLDTPGRIGVYMDMQCEENIRFLQEATPEEFLFTLKCSWLIDVGFTGGMKILSTINLGYVNDVTVATQNTNNRQHLELHHTYTEPFGAMKFVSISVGSWTGYGKLSYNLPRINYTLHMRSLKAAIFMTQDIYHDGNLYAELQNKTYMPSLDTANRFYYAVGLHVADLYNYSLELVKSDDWGVRLSYGNYTGMLGLLKKGKADLTIGPMRLAEERLDLFAPLFPIQRFKFPFVFKQPRKTGTYRALALQLKTDVWIFTGTMAAVICVVLSGIQWFRNLMKRRIGNSTIQEEAESLSFNALLVIGTMAQQGLMSDPPDIARRIACFFLLFCFLMVATYYNAATMNALLSSSPLSIRNIEELLESNVPLALNDVPYFTHAPIRKVLMGQKVVDRVDYFNLSFLSLEEGLQLILKGGAFAGEDFTLFKGIHANFQDEQKCDISVIQPSRPFPASFWILKNSPYREIMFQGTLRVKEHGLVDRQYRYWYPAPPECLVNQQWLWVGLEAVSIALVIFAVGFLLSSTIFILELASYFKIRQKNRTNRSL